MKAPSAPAGNGTPDSDSAAWFARALELERSGKRSDAEDVYRSLLARHPDNPAILNNLALLLRAQGRLPEAEACARRAIEKDPRTPAYVNTLGAILRKDGRPDEAEACYRKAIELWPGYPEPHFNLGLIHESRGDVDAALAAYREALERNPRYSEARGRLAALLQGAGRPDEALRSLDAVPEDAKPSFDLHYYRGNALSALRRYDDALNAYDEARRIKPESLEATLGIANALREAGRIDDALRAYWQALERAPGRIETHAELNRLAYTAARRDLYLASFRYARERLGADPALLHLEAAFHLRQQAFADAERLLREARQAAPERGDVAGLLARAVAGQGRFEESYPLFLEAVTREPDVMRHRQEFGFTLLKDRQATRALAVFEQALRVNPFDQLVLAGLSLAYRELADSRYHALVDFDRYVRVYELQAPRGMHDIGRFNRLLAEALQRLHTSKVEPVDQTLRGGTQSTGSLFDAPDPMIQHLRERVEAAVQDYLKQLEANPWHPVALRKPESVRFAGSWSCWLKSGGYHANHVHPEGWLSSAYYVRLPELVPDSKAGWLKFGESNLGLGTTDIPHQDVQPAVGRLVLFPSYFWHGTVPFSGGDRLAVAFDVAPGSGSLPRPPPAPP